MADIMIDNWTLQRAAISINDTYEKISSPNEEYVKLIEQMGCCSHLNCPSSYCTTSPYHRFVVHQREEDFAY